MTQPPSDPYGSQPPEDPSGAPSDPYGAPPPASSPYGAPQPSDPYGAPPPSNPYGAPPPPNPYGAGPGGGAPAPHPRGVLVLVLGILSLFCCGIVLGTIALVLGLQAKKEIDANPGAYTNRGMVMAGTILGAVGIVFSIIGGIWYLSQA